MRNLYPAVLLLISFIGMDVSAQSKELVKNRSNFFVSGTIGYQMSGIKDEDFVRNNYSPMLKMTGGMWFSPLLALEIGYRGFYFNTIENSDRRYYNYFYGSTIFDLLNIIDSNQDSDLKLYLKIGSGYFYNFYYNQPNIIASFEFAGLIKLNEQLNLQIEASSLMGWDIYQGDEDILPSISAGFLYKWN
tara:strand:- start:328221 stop:328787 length:567 start_codon:yes stop_codon:yes gene_type:complete